MNYQILKIGVTEGIATVTISRPQALNALNSRFLEEMNAWIEEIARRDDVKVVIITGEGKAFVAGADIAEMASKNQEEAREFSKRGQETLRGLELVDQPVIAAINGFALGGGCELAMACDVRIASTKAKFGQPEVNLGIIPGYAGTQRLPRLVGLGDALYLMLTGEMIGAEEALRLGLVQKVVEPDQLMSVAVQVAKTIASKGPKAVKAVKQVARRGLSENFDAGCALESETFSAIFEGEGIEGMRAFLEKRSPKWGNS